MTREEAIEEIENRGTDKYQFMECLRDTAIMAAYLRNHGDAMDYFNFNRLLKQINKVREYAENLLQLNNPEKQEKFNN